MASRPPQPTSNSWAGIWVRWRAIVVDAFVTANLAFLAVDIYLAHSINDFAHPAEWVPFAFSIAGTLGMIACLTLGLADRARANRWLGHTIGWLSVGVGIAGMLLHLESTFFEEATLKNLIYSAPFVAPLAYTGLGLLVIMNHMVEPATMAWARWIVLLALAGWVGNFGLSLADHAQNAFFDPAEWISVVAAALAVGFLAVPAAFDTDRRFIGLCLAVMALEVGVGLLGAFLHVRGALETEAQTLFGRAIFGPPLFAPLLFANLALLAALGLWDMRLKLKQPADDQPIDEQSTAPSEPSG